MAPSVRTVGAAMLATAAASPLSLSDLKHQVGDDIALRILPIGDAAIKGSDELPDAYRTELTRLLEKDGYNVEFVETEDAEGALSKGVTIEELASKAETSVPHSLPNLVILNAGTADCQDGADGNEVSDKITKLLGAALGGSTGPAVVLTTSVLPEDTEVQQCVNDVNNKIRKLVDIPLQEENKVVLVDFDADKPVETGDDGIPTEEGYKTIAQLLYTGIEDISERSWFEVPEGAPELGEGDIAKDASSEAESETNPTPTSSGANGRRQALEEEAPTTATTADFDVGSLADDEKLRAAFEKFREILKQIQDGKEGANKRRQENGRATRTWADTAETPIVGDKERAAFKKFLDIWKQIQGKKNDGEESSQEERQKGGVADLPNIAQEIAMPSATLSPDDIDALLEDITEDEVKKWLGGNARRDDAEGASLGSAF